jgi:RNase P subunit RPR2
MVETMAESLKRESAEIERIACSACAGFLRLEASLSPHANGRRYHIMRCGGCATIQWIADDRESKEHLSRVMQALKRLRASHRCSVG